jgi:hypothetical protein
MCDIPIDYALAGGASLMVVERRNALRLQVGLLRKRVKWETGRGQDGRYGHESMGLHMQSIWQWQRVDHDSGALFLVLSFLTRYQYDVQAGATEEIGGGGV